MRAELVDRQRGVGGGRGGGVIEGRDIGTVVFPDARLKLYVTASPTRRAERRVGEIGGDLDDVESAIVDRDRVTDPVDSPLREVDGAVAVDTSDLTIDEVVDRIVEMLTRSHGGVTSSPARASTSRMAYLVARSIYGFCRLYRRRSIDGRENVPPTGAFVLAPVHRSYVDTPFACCVTRRRLRYMGKDTLWEQPAVRRGSCPRSAGSPSPAGRPTGRRCGAASPCSAWARCLVLYPEGERKDGPTVQPLFDGPAYVALKAGVPIVPVGIGGSDRVMPKGARFVFPHKVHVVIGPPIPAPIGAGARPAGRAQGALTDRLHAEFQRLYDEAQRRAGAQVVGVGSK